jgi:hypothetical protein
MKKTLLLLLLVAAGTAACKKDKQIAPGMFGTWELRSISGGWGLTQAYPAGNGIKYQFKSDSSYVKYKSDVIENQGKFSVRILGKERGFDYGTIKFTQPDYSDAFQIKNDTIYIGTSIADGPTYQYIKIN